VLLKFTVLFSCVLLMIGLTSCSKNIGTINRQKGIKMTYVVKRASGDVILGSKWESDSWAGANVIELKNYMGDQPKHFPRTQAKLLYDDENIYVFFKVEDQYIRAVADRTHGSICQDSCVEFFFTPSEDLSKGYFNLEINCGGTILLHYGNDIMAERKPLEIAECEMIETFHSLPKIIDPEITEPTTWVLQYRLPVNILSNYCSIDKPASGVKWRANLYKCADGTSHPHWLTWSFVDNPTPRFHLPKYFGSIEFE
jgi:hypothetical protein